MAVTVVVLAIASPAPAAPAASSSSSKAKGGTGALIELRSETATFVPTSDDGLQGVLVMPEPSATVDHDPSEGDATRFPALRAAMSLRDEPTVQAVLRRPGAPGDQDAYGLTLSDISYTKVAGFSATAAVRPSVGGELLDGERRGLDPGPPPVDLGAVALAAADTNVRISGSNRAQPPAPEENYTMYATVTTHFDTASFVFTPRSLHCATAETHTMVLSKDQHTSLPMEIDTAGSCGWDFSTALWDVSIQPTGVNDLDKLYVYLHIDQVGPLIYTASCQTINQPKRPTCTSRGALNDNEVTFGFFPG